MKKVIFLVFVVIFVLIGLNSCEQPSSDDGDTGIWNKVVNVTNYTLDIVNSKLVMSMTEGITNGLVSIDQSGLTGDFSCVLTFSDFTADNDTGIYFAMAVSTFSCSIGKMPSESTIKVAASITGQQPDIKVADGTSGTFTITRTGSNMTCSYVCGTSTGSMSGMDTGTHGIILKLHNNSGSANTGTVSINLDDFAVTGGGGTVESDDFTTNKIIQ